jgi:hypothetical protein
VVTQLRGAILSLENVSGRAPTGWPSANPVE